MPYRNRCRIVTVTVAAQSTTGHFLFQLTELDQANLTIEGKVLVIELANGDHPDQMLKSEHSSLDSESRFRRVGAGDERREVPQLGLEQLVN